MAIFAIPVALGATTYMTFMDSILDSCSPATDQLFQTAIALSTYPSSTTIEPLPHLDYLLIHRLFTLARPHLNKHELKRMEYLIDGRRSFYEGHQKFQLAYCDLLDANVCAGILDTESEELGRRLADTLAANSTEEGNRAAVLIRQRLCVLDTQRRINNEDLRTRLENLRAKIKGRQHAAVWFSDLKVVFLRDEMPWLMAVGRQSLDRAMGRREERPGVDSPPSPSSDEWRSMDGIDAGEAVEDADLL